MKNLKVIALSAMLATGYVNTTNAAVGTVAALSGDWGHGIQYALLGLGWVGIGNLTKKSSSKLGMVSLVFGVILLDEDNQKVEFSKISNETANKYELTQGELNSYNAEIEEINLVFSEVSTILNSDSSEAEAKLVWDDHKELLSNDSFNALKKLLK